VIRKSESTAVPSLSLSTSLTTVSFAVFSVFVMVPVFVSPGEIVPVQSAETDARYPEGPA